MSSAAAGWYVDPSTGTNLRYWSGSTWTDEVAPLPVEPVHSGPVDLFGLAARAAESSAATGASPATTTSEEPSTPATASEPASDPVEVEPVEAEPEAARAERAPEQEPAPTPAAAAADPGGDDTPPLPDLDPDVERTLLTRRELRARRGSAPEPDDTPKHLPPMTLPAAAPFDGAPEPVDEVEIPLQPPVAPLEAETADPVARRRRIIRLSVLLGILAVTSSVAVLTAGTL